MDGKLKKAIQDALRMVCLTLPKPTAGDIQDILHKQGMTAQQLQTARERCLPSSACRGCGGPLTADTYSVWTTYWQQMWAPCHVQCRDEGMKTEAYDCQCIDADCNDCVHFKRGQGLNGTCGLTGQATVALPVFASGHDCFQHRRGTKER